MPNLSHFLITINPNISTRTDARIMEVNNSLIAWHDKFKDDPTEYLIARGNKEWDMANLVDIDVSASIEYGNMNFNPHLHMVVSVVHNSKNLMMNSTQMRREIKADLKLKHNPHLNVRASGDNLRQITEYIKKPNSVSL